ncbi:sugar ABC transporter substrate-binding protein [Treponema primitia]|uniref:sugar ABC transporter substrate-binding protein n=1 Tax=Treponema primitia TaxID=88058 RepID=UPI00397FEEED
MKKFLVAVLALTMVCSTMAFAAGGKDTGKKRVLFVARTLGDTFPAWLRSALEEEVKKYPDIVLTSQDGQGSDQQIADFVDNGITNKFDVILLQPQNTEAQRPPAERAVKAGIPLVTVNLRIPGMENVSNSVDASPFDQGGGCAKLALTQIPQGARVVVLNGPAAHPHSNERRRAWQEIFFNARPDIVKLAEDYANWNKDEAMKLMEDWVQAHGKIDAVISMNDNMATGAIEVIKDNPAYANLLVYGVDGTAEAALLIQQGKMTATSFQNAYALAENSLNIINAILSGTQQGFSNIDIECPVITKDNVQSLIDTHKRAGAL